MEGKAAARRAWAPPTHEESCACLQKQVRPQQCRPCRGGAAEPLLVTAARSGLYQPKAPPAWGDWLADGGPGEVDRGGQTPEQWRQNCWPQRLPEPPPRGRRRRKSNCKIYLVPLGDVASDLDIEALCDGVRAFYFGATVELLPAVSQQKLRAQVKVDGGQFETLSSQKLLTRMMPADATFLVGVTCNDLYKDGFGFVYGEANATRGTGVFSLAQSPKDGYTRHALKVLCHEMGHLFGISHCIWWQCIMNGGNGHEVESMPLHLCPLDLAKLQEALGFDLVERERALEAMWVRHGLDDEARFSQQLIGTLAKAAAPKATPVAGKTGVKAQWKPSKPGAKGK